MKITVVVPDGFVSIDGVGYTGLDLTGLDPSFRAVHWDTELSVGGIEIGDTLRVFENRSIALFEEKDFILGVWQQAHSRYLAELEKPVVPGVQSVTPRQARLALLNAGLLDQIDTTINGMSEPDQSVARINWEYATEIVRNDPWVLGLGAALGLDDAGLDQLFITAATL
jgi:hypothetical protein